MNYSQKLISDAKAFIKRINDIPHLNQDEVYTTFEDLVSRFTNIPKEDFVHSSDVLAFQGFYDKNPFIEQYKIAVQQSRKSVTIDNYRFLITILENEINIVDSLVLRNYSPKL